MGTGATFKELLDEAQSKSPFQIEYSASGYAASDHTSFVGQENSSALLFLGIALGLSQTFRHLGENQCAGCGRLLDFIDDVALKIDSARERVAIRRRGAEDQPGGQAASGGGGGMGPTSARFRISAGGKRRAILRCAVRVLRPRRRDSKPATSSCNLATRRSIICTTSPTPCAAAR